MVPKLIPVESLKNKALLPSLGQITLIAGTPMGIVTYLFPYEKPSLRVFARRGLVIAHHGTYAG